MYKEDYGKYSCEAGNKYGKAIQHLELYESSIPICPPLCGDTDLNSAADPSIAKLESMKKSLIVIGTAFALVQRIMMMF